MNNLKNLVQDLIKLNTSQYYKPKDITITHCHHCKSETIHCVEHSVMSNGVLYRKGKCLDCGSGPRALSHDEDIENYRMPYGKYENFKLKDIASKDYDYLLWCSLNLTNFKVKAKIDKFIEKFPFNKEIHK